MHRQLLCCQPVLAILCWVGSAVAESPAGGAAPGSAGAITAAPESKRERSTHGVDPGTAQDRPSSRDHDWTVPTVHAAGLMTTMRIAEAVLWPDPFADTRLDRIGAHYEAAFTRPPIWDGRKPAFRWDGDPWVINVVGHGLLGSELYLRARMCRHNIGLAAVFTAVSSAVWEYGFEASGVRPSAQDLVYTPVAGVLLGEARLWLWRAGAKSPGRAWGRVLSWVADPLGELERAAGSGC